MDFPDFLSLFSLVDLGDVDPFLSDELTDLQSDASVATIQRVKRQLMWLNDEMQEKYPKLENMAVKPLSPFPSAYLFECAFSTVTDIPTKKRCSLNIVGCGELCLRLTKIIPALNKHHQAQWTH